MLAKLKWTPEDARDAVLALPARSANTHQLGSDELTILLHCLPREVRVGWQGLPM